MFVISLITFLLLTGLIYGQETNTTAFTLSPEEQKLFDQEKCALLLPHLEEAVKSLTPEQTTNLSGDILCKTGACYNALSRYEDALAVLNRAEKIFSNPDSQDALAFVLLEKAASQRLLGNSKEAVTLAQKTLTMEKLSKNRLGEAAALRELAAIDLAGGGYPDALKSIKSSLEIEEQLNHQMGIAKSLKDLGAVYYRLGQTEDSLQVLQKSLKIAEELDDEYLQAKVISNMAVAHGHQGDFQQELEDYKKAAVLADRAGDLNQQTIIELNAGAAYYNLGNYGKSHDSYVKGVSLSQQTKNQKLYSGALLGLSMTEFEFGNDEAAMNYLQKCVDIAEKTNDKNVLHYGLNELGSHSFEAGNISQALNYFSRSLKIAEEMDDKYAIAYSYTYMGSIYEKQKNYDKALESFNKALAVSEAAGLKKAIADSHEEIAQLRYTRKEMDAAAMEVDKAIELARQVGERDLLSYALHTRGLILRDTGKIDEAIDSMQEAVRVIESIRSELGSSEEKAGFLEQRREIYEDLILLLNQQGKTSEAFDFAQRSKARAFLDLLGEWNIDIEKNLPHDLREKKEKLINEMMDVQGEIRDEEEKDTPAKAKVASLEQKSNQLDGDYRTLIREIRKQAPQLAVVRYPEPLDVSQSQALLDDQTVLLEYFVGKEGSLVFAITSDSLKTYPVPPEKNLSGMISEIRDALQKPDPVMQASEGAYVKYLKSSDALYRALFRPVEGTINGKRRLLIAPDGPLYYLPFECLLRKPIQSDHPDFSKLPYVARDFEVQYIPSASILASLLSQKGLFAGKAAQKELLAFADPSLPAAKGKNGTSTVRSWVGTLTQLPYTRTEVEGIAHLYPPETISIFMGNQATEKKLKQTDLENYRRLHFASHGLIDEDKPEFSALVLGPDQEEAEDGFLTMREVFELKMNADLVVLSACKTGLGKTIRGEGVSGLSRAFLSSGAQNVLVSLWNVYDLSTATFMKDFYREMEQKESDKLKALKDARELMMQSGKYSHPYYWAPFILIGSD